MNSLGKLIPRLPTSVLILAVAAMFFAALSGWQPDQAQAQSAITVRFDNINIPIDEPEGHREVLHYPVLVVLDQPSPGGIRVDYITQEVTAQPHGVDYSDVRGTLRFPAGSTSQTFTVPIYGDSIKENTNRFSMKLTNPVGARFPGQTAFYEGQITITDTDPLFETWLDYPEFAREDGPDYDLVLRQSGMTDFDYTVIIQIAYDASADESDVHSYSRTITIQPYTLETLIPNAIQLINDDRKEGPEYFDARVLRNGLADISTLRRGGTGNFVWILDDDMPIDIHVTRESHDNSSLKKKHLQVAEAGTGGYSIWLPEPPEEDVRVSALPEPGDDDITLTSETFHTFTRENWNIPFPVTFEVQEDNDAYDGRRKIFHGLRTTDPVYSKSDPRHVTVVEKDNEPVATDHATAMVTHPSVNNGITSQFEYTPKQHDGDPFLVRIAFSDRAKIGYAEMRDHALEVTRGTVTQAYRTHGASDDWTFVINPKRDDASVIVKLRGNRDCQFLGAVCGPGQRRLANTITLTLPGPE